MRKGAILRTLAPKREREKLLWKTNRRKALAWGGEKKEGFQRKSWPPFTNREGEGTRKSKTHIKSARIRMKEDTFSKESS